MPHAERPEMNDRADVIVDFTAVAPLLVVADVAATAAWYEGLLGFKSDVFPAQPPHSHAILWRDDVRILLRAVERPGPTPATGALLNVKGILGLYEAIREQVPIASRLARHSDGTWQFEIRDPDGYTLVFVEEPEIA
jgi:Glyoxalase/Bleomycin resistance protein/Dioxygenase superfamily